MEFLELKSSKNLVSHFKKKFIIEKLQIIFLSYNQKEYKPTLLHNLKYFYGLQRIIYG